MTIDIQQDKDFDAFYDAHQERVFGFLIWMGIAPNEAEETVNDCFAALFFCWPDVPAGKRRVYLYRIVTNEAYRRRSFTSQSSVDFPKAKQVTLVGDFGRKEADRVVMHAALSHLTDREREAVLLRYYVGCGIEESAMIMDNIEPNSVERYASHGHDKLSLALTADERQDDAGDRSS